MSTFGLRVPLDVVKETKEPTPEESSRSRPKVNAWSLGLDNHKEIVAWVLFDSEGTAVGHGEIHATRKALLALVDAEVGDKWAHAAFEASGCCMWAFDLLVDRQGARERIHVAHAKSVRAIANSRHKTDHNDAWWLGYLTYEGRLPEVFVPTGLVRDLRLATRHRAVPFACHGLIDLERPLFPALALTGTSKDDGFLTAREVLRMDISADLVVLTACESGTGKVVHGEGIMGLTLAFMYAGTPRVLCSLWRVDDEATRALMTEFHRLWNAPGKERLSAARALRLAQAHVRAQPKWAHPYHWAAWILLGLPG